ncbi:Xaa-Pro dipeptidase [Gordoniibacillus kamchatkensis]|uniref:Xaa-Pro dipeptidase n=1 Tax=Gordoniibacillus kamchatkensis TaxID=1590651 RepID=A0ABR5AJV1_9BACL|nr:Xaa-Pro peptidase family protein [Paenibacillus sp. VKM B-2647]KIL41123.1 Xaa-Pro dipeptidase [Paenibacillus sp. VKM B-2647]
MHQQRLEKLRQRIIELQIDALLVASGVNRTYLTGFAGSSGYVLVTQQRAMLLTDFRYVTQAHQQAPDYEIIEHAAKPAATILELLQAAGVTKLGFEQQHVSFGAYQNYVAALPGITLVPTDGVVEKLRMYKDEGELRIMREAAELADRTFSYILTKLKPGVTELDIALEIEMFIRQNGGTSTSFDTIVASGERSALPHGRASERVLQKDEFVKLDFGAYYKGYCSDITRTVVLGKPTAKHRDIYDKVLEAQLACLDGLKPGMTGREGDALARDIIEKYGYGDNFGHGTGHSLGMEIHEAPRLSRLDETVLEPGMTMTVEPGIYLPGFGGVRIEDDIVFTDSGIRILTQSTKQLIILD